MILTLLNFLVDLVAAVSMVVAGVLVLLAILYTLLPDDDESDSRP